MSTLFSNKIRTGAIWSYAGQVYLMLGHFIAGIILARILGPEDFGVFISVTAFTSIFLIGVQFGLPQAIIQATNLTNEQINAAFWAISLFALLFIVLILIIAKPLSETFSSEQFFLALYLMTVVFLLTPYISVARALLRREMNFERLARLNVLSMTISTFAEIMLAFLGAGVYALPFGAIVNMVVMSLGLMTFLDWRPSLPQIASVRPLLSYSVFMAINNLTSIAIERVDNMLVGALLSPHSLGIYNRAYSFARIPGEQFSESLGPLVMSSLSRIQDDVDWSRQLYFKAACMISIVTMPFLAFLFVTGPAVIEFLYGPKWIDAGTPLQVMIIAAFFVMLSLTIREFANAQGLIRQSAMVNIIVLIITILAVAGLAHWGLVAISVGITIREILLFWLMVRILRQSKIDLRFRQIFYAIAPSMTASGVALLVGYPMFGFAQSIASNNLFIQLVIVGITCFFAYGFCLLVLLWRWRSHAPLMTARELAMETLTALYRRARGAKRIATESP